MAKNVGPLAGVISGGSTEQPRRPFVRPFEDNFPKCPEANKMGGTPQNLNISMTMYTPPVSEQEVAIKDEKPEMTSEMKPFVVKNGKMVKMSLKDSIQHHQSTDGSFEVTDNMNNNIPSKKVNLVITLQL
jgi:hypothetical protein